LAQVYDPKLLIAEFTAPRNDFGSGPATLDDGELEQGLAAAWWGLPDVPQRASLVFDDPSIDRVNASVQTSLARAKHIELHGPPRRRLAVGSSRDRKPC